jgi:hypothetical protein
VHPEIVYNQEDLTWRVFDETAEKSDEQAGVQRALEPSFPLSFASSH